MENSCITASFHEEGRFGFNPVIFFAEVHVPSNENGPSFMCAIGIDFAYFYDVLIDFDNLLTDVVFSLVHFITKYNIQNKDIHEDWFVIDWIMLSL